MRKNALLEAIINVSVIHATCNISFPLKQCSVARLGPSAVDKRLRRLASVRLQRIV